ncbi:MAG: hypothetical protein JWR80_1221 [Bradyrhizobium sp.]|nr:hypothetical protein [Bradyrhizobium sp.]
MAEDFLALMCSAQDIVANRVEDDQRGWDFFLEYPAIHSDLPPDLRPTPHSCLIQVKSSQRAKRSWTLKLSNALRYAQTNAPYFVVLMIFLPNALKPSKVYVQHFWTEQIREALAAGRRAHLEGLDALHTIDFPISFEAHEASTPEDFVSKITETLDEIGPSYVTQKQQLLSTLGYEEGVAVGRFRLGEGVEPEAFVDMLLGRGDVEVTGFELQDKRFDLPGPSLAPTMNGRLSVVIEPKAECSVVVSGPKGTEPVRLVGAVYSPGLPGLPKELQKLRVLAPPLDLILRPFATTEATLTHDGSEPLEILDLYRRSTIWSWSDRGDVRIEVWAHGRLMINGELQLSGARGAAYWRRLKQALRRLLDFAPADLWPASARFKVVDMMEELDDLAKFAGMITEPGVEMTVGEIPSDAEDMLNDCRRFLAGPWMQLNDVTLYAVLVSDIDEVKIKDGKAVIRLGKPTVLRRAVLSGPASDHEDYILATFDAVREAEGGPDVLYMPPSCGTDGSTADV